MGFTSNLEQVHNPATRYLRWKGGAEKVREDGVEKVEGGKLVYWDKENQEEIEVALPLVFCPLEITYGYTGFIPDKGRIWSNEILDFNSQRITVNITGEDTEVICSGNYETIKDKAYASGARLQTYVYAYCKQLGGIVRLNLGGSARSAWKEFSKKVKLQNIFSCPVSMSADEPKESKLGPFVPPKYELGQKYSDEVVNKLREQDAVVINYLKYLSERTPAEEVNNVFPEDGSQEIPEQIQETMGGGEEISLDEVPF